VTKRHQTITFEYESPNDTDYFSAITGSLHTSIRPEWSSRGDGSEMWVVAALPSVPAPINWWDFLSRNKTFTFFVRGDKATWRAVKLYERGDHSARWYFTSDQSAIIKSHSTDTVIYHLSEGVWQPINP
jgi:hypothetical protein